MECLCLISVDYPADGYTNITTDNTKSVRDFFFNKVSNFDKCVVNLKSIKNLIFNRTWERFLVTNFVDLLNGKEETNIRYLKGKSLINPTFY